MARSHAFWVILAGAVPTAFRSPKREDLLPTLHQLQRKQPDVTLQWFDRGRLWESPEAARAALLAKLPQFPDRKADWRPGGSHKDPRARYQLSRDQKRARFKKRLGRPPLESRSDKPSDSRPDRPPESRPPRPGGPPRDRWQKPGGPPRDRWQKPGGPPRDRWQKPGGPPRDRWQKPGGHRAIVRHPAIVGKNPGDRHQGIAGRNRSRSANARSGPTAIVPIDRRVIGLVARPAIVLAGHLVIVPVGRPARVASPSGTPAWGRKQALRRAPAWRRRQAVRASPARQVQAAGPARA